MRQPWKGRPGAAVALAVAVWLALVAGSPAAAYEEMSAWRDMGTVQDWMNLDARFFRSFDDNRWVDRSQFSLDQRDIYAACLEYRHPLPAVTLETFQSLSPEERGRRLDAALDQMAYVERYFLRVHSQVQRLRENLASGWGDWVSDSTVLGDMLLKLRTACGLDPRNYYAWHLLSYFATCAGDEERALEYLAAAEAALARTPPGTSNDVRHRLGLDRAWLLRGRGLFDEALAQVKAVEGLTWRGMNKGPEARLLRGLIAAQTGDTDQAQAWADELARSEVRRFPANFRTTDFQPELLDPANWKVGTSSYLADWIRALMLLHEGQAELARGAFGSFRMDDHYPFGWRFWNEAGYIYEATGRSGEAIRAWNTALVNRPWLRNMVYKPYEIALGVLTGHETRAPYMLGYDSFYMAGSRLAFAASLVGKVGSLDSPQEKQRWAGRALDELEVCKRAGAYPGQALVLQGHVYYLLGDMESAVQRLEAALAHLERQGDLEVQQAVMKDLNALHHNRQAGEMKSLFKQSGNSRGRWRAEPDPEARIAQLVADVERSPDSRRLRIELARALIRNGRPLDGRAMIERDAENQETAELLTLLVEADRLQGRSQLALSLVARLERDEVGGLADAGLWSLVGALCLEQGHREQAAAALEHALLLDPENQGVRMQLRVMGD